MDTLPIWRRSASIGADPDDEFARWRQYVLDEVARVRREGINPNLFNSWPLRKAVRVGAPVETIRWLAERSDPMANRCEAWRYAVADIDHPEILGALQSAVGKIPRDFHITLWSALAGNWSVLRLVLEQIPAADRRGQRVAGRVINATQVPQDRLPLGYTVDSADVGLPFSLGERMRGYWNDDDADNYPSAHGLDVRIAGQQLPENWKSDAPMSSWLPQPARPDDTTYVESLAMALPRRYTGLQLLGAGGYGIVFAADHRGGNVTRVAVKVSALADPLNSTPTRRAQHTRDELTINLLMNNSQAFTRAYAVFVRVLDWTRGRLDVAQAVATMGDPDGAKRFTPGLGIYQVMEMRVFDLTLLQWQRSLRAGPFDDYHRQLTVWIAILLGQLLVLHREFGLRHNDIKADNILLWNVSQRPVLTRAGWLVNVPAVLEQRSLRLTASHAGNVVPSLADFGLASIERPRRIGGTRTIRDDVERLLASLSSSVAPPWVAQALAGLGRSDMRDQSNEVKILWLFATQTELKELLSD